MQYFSIYNISSNEILKKKKKNNQQTSISQNRLSLQNWGDETVKAAYDGRACKFNMDIGCVELLLRNGRKISIDCTGGEDALDVISSYNNAAKIGQSTAVRTPATAMARPCSCMSNAENSSKVVVLFSTA